MRRYAGSVLWSQWIGKECEVSLSLSRVGEFFYALSVLSIGNCLTMIKKNLYSFERSTYEDKQLAKDRTFGHRSRPVNLLRQHGSASASCLVPDVARMDCSGRAGLFGPFPFTG